MLMLKGQPFYKESESEDDPILCHITQFTSLKYPQTDGYPNGLIFFDFQFFFKIQ